jgi:hypothetical protein
MRHRAGLLCASLVACAAPRGLPTPTVDEPDPAPGDPTTAVAYPRPCGDLFDGDELLDVALELSEADWTGLQADHAAGLRVERPVLIRVGEDSARASVRVKGDWSWHPEKMQLVVSFQAVDHDDRFHGMRAMSLDAPWYDRSMLHERLAFPIFARAGVPASCVNHARLTIQGEYYGLFVHTERMDREYLERNFADPDGNLYDASHTLVTNEDEEPDLSRLAAYHSAQTLDEIAAVVDLDAALQEWAVEAMIPANDNFWAGVEINYYLYEHPARGMVFLPYDMDATFGTAQERDGAWVWPDSATADPITWAHTWWGKEPMVMTALADPATCEAFVEALRRARVAYDVPTLLHDLDRWAAQIRDAVAADPHRPWTLEQHEAAVAALREAIVARAAFVDDWLADGGHCPAVWPASSP